MIDVVFETLYRLWTEFTGPFHLSTTCIVTCPLNCHRTRENYILVMKYALSHFLKSQVGFQPSQSVRSALRWRRATSQSQTTALAVWRLGMWNVSMLRLALNSFSMFQWKNYTSLFMFSYWITIRSEGDDNGSYAKPGNDVDRHSIVDSCWWLQNYGTLFRRIHSFWWLSHIVEQCLHTDKNL